MRDFPKIVRERLQRTGVGNSHPDADLLTAFAEKILAANEREHVVRHLAQCGECREIVLLALPEAEDAAQAFESRTRVNWLRWPALRWAAVAAGILVVTAVGVQQFRQNPNMTQLAANLVAKKQLAAAQVAPLSAATPATPVSSSLQEARPKHVEMEKKTAARAGYAAAADSADNANALFPRSNQMGSGVGGGIGSGAGGGMATGSAVSQEVTSSNNRPPAANVDAAKLNSPVPLSSQVVEVAGAAPPAESDSSTQANHVEVARNQDSDALLTSGKQSEAVVRAKPTLAQNAATASLGGLHKDASPQKSPALRWNIGVNGALQKSMDGGSTWSEMSLTAESSKPNLVGQAQSEIAVGTSAQPRSAKRADAKAAPASVVPVVFRALSVSSNGAEVWAGGAAGVLYHTMDGGDLWVRVIPSEAGIALHGDIVGIEFSDLRNGTVITSDASVWATRDNGQNWHKQQ